MTIPGCDDATTRYDISADDDAALRRGELACACGSPLAPWGYGVDRAVRDLHGRSRRLRPRRARCTDCRRTTMLFPAWSLFRRRDTIDVVGAALLAHAAGHGHRTIARDLDRPASTVRGWLRRARATTEGLRVQATIVAHAADPLLPPIQPRASALGDALEAIGVAATALARRLSIDEPPWWTAGRITRGRLLASSAAG